MAIPPVRAAGDSGHVGDSNDVRDELILAASHRASTANPHATTAAQVGAYTEAEVDALLAGLGAGGHVIEGEGTPLTARSTLNFVGAGVTAADSGGKTTVTIPGGGSATGVLHYVLGVSSPGAGLGSVGDFAFNESGSFFLKTDVTIWTRLGSLSAFMPQLQSAGWTNPTAEMNYVRSPNKDNAAWVKTGLATQSGEAVTFVGASANASAKLSIPYTARHVAVNFILTAKNTGAAIQFGLGVTPGTAPWPMIEISTAGVVKVVTGSGATIKTLSGTAVAADTFHFAYTPGLVAITWCASDFTQKDALTFSSNFVNQENVALNGLDVWVQSLGAETVAQVSCPVRVSL